MGSFCKSLKIEKTIAYAFNNVSLNWSITKGARGFQSLSSKVVFGVRYIRGFCKFPGWLYYETLLWFMTLHHTLSVVTAYNCISCSHVCHCLPKWQFLKVFVMLEIGLCHETIVQKSAIIKFAKTKEAFCLKSFMVHLYTVCTVFLYL